MQAVGVIRPAIGTVHRVVGVIRPAVRTVHRAVGVIRPAARTVHRAVRALRQATRQVTMVHPMVPARVIVAAMIRVQRILMQKGVAEMRYAVIPIIQSNIIMAGF